jgi:hypothetical protein
MRSIYCPMAQYTILLQCLVIVTSRSNLNIDLQLAGVLNKVRAGVSQLVS